MKQGPTGRTLALGSRRDPEGPWTRRGVPAGDYMPRAALVVTHFFLGENRHAPPQNGTFFGFIVTRQTAMPVQIVLRFCARGMVDSKSYCTVVKTHRDETSQVTDLSPG